MQKSGSNVMQLDVAVTEDGHSKTLPNLLLCLFAHLAGCFLSCGSRCDPQRDHRLTGCDTHFGVTSASCQAIQQTFSFRFAVAKSANDATTHLNAAIQQVRPHQMFKHRPHFRRDPGHRSQQAARVFGSCGNL